MKIGDTIYHPRFGECELQNIDSSHHPLAIVVVKNKTECIEAGQPICRELREFFEKPLDN